MHFESIRVRRPRERGRTQAVTGDGNRRAVGYGVIGSTPEAFSAFLSAEYDKWGKLISSAGHKAD